MTGRLGHSWPGFAPCPSDGSPLLAAAPPVRRQVSAWAVLGTRQTAIRPGARIHDRVPSVPASDQCRFPLREPSRSNRLASACEIMLPGAKSVEGARLGAAAFTLVFTCGAQQPLPETLREEALTPEQFRAAHASLTATRDPGGDPATLTESVAPEAGDSARHPIPRRNFVDDRIFSTMQAAGVAPSPLAGDAEFLRRVHLDIAGRIPNAREIREFLADPSPGKRADKIDELLRGDEFSEKWAYYYMDLFRANGKMGRGRELFHYWLKENLRSDRPYDEWVRAIITSAGKSSNVLAASNVIAREHVQGKAQPDDGHDWGMVHQLDTHDELTILYGKAFLGINLSCISCHDGASHLEEVNAYLAGRTRSDFQRQAAFLGNTRYLMYWEDGDVKANEFLIDDLAPGYDTLGPSMLRVARWGGDAAPRFMLTGEQPLAGENPRDALARMLTAHPQFSRATVNLFWKQLMGYGIVEPHDEFDLGRQDPSSLPEGWHLQPTHPELLSELAADFRESGHSLKHLIRRICNSSAYQLSASYPGEWHASYRKYFARKFVRMLTAEELHDAIAVATSRPGRFQFGGETVGMAMQLSEPQGGPDLKFLLRTFGQSTRRNPPKPLNGSLRQSLALMESPVVGERVKAEKDSLVQRLLDSYDDDDRVVGEIFLATLAREPSPAELSVALEELARDRSRGAENLQWALINNVEFFFNH